MAGPLAGIRVLDLTSSLMGPHATRMLADMGAEAVKVAPPEGDVVRHIGPARNAGMGPIFLNTTRGKRSPVLDLNKPDGLAAALPRRQKTGQGQRVDVPMSETMLPFVLGDHLGGPTFAPPHDAGGHARMLSPGRRPYRTRDGRICAMVHTDKHRRAFRAGLGIRTSSPPTRASPITARASAISTRSSTWSRASWRSATPPNGWSPSSGPASRPCR